MSEPTGAGVAARSETYCDRCDLLVGLPGLRVVGVGEDGHRLGDRPLDVCCFDRAVRVAGGCEVEEGLEGRDGEVVPGLVEVEVAVPCLTPAVR